MEPQTVGPTGMPAAPPAGRGPSAAPRPHRQRASGQAIVEFALVSFAFFTMVFGTIDFGRAVFLYSQLHNAVREGARYGKIAPANTGAIKDKVIAYGSGLRLAPADVTVSCTGGCGAAATDVTVSARAPFAAVTQGLLGIGPLTLTASATVVTD